MPQTLTQLLHLLHRQTVPCPDRVLLEHFLGSRAEAAFTALVTRHEPMVLRLCRRWLRKDQDVEDAFQATFLVLACRASAIRGRDCLAAWLHGVAYRVASRTRVADSRQQLREAPSPDLNPPDPHLDPLDELTARELLTGIARPVAKRADQPKPGGGEQGRTDRHGDLLPPGALARMGTLRFRHWAPLRGAAYSADGKLLASAGTVERQVRLWDATTGRLSAAPRSKRSNGKVVSVSEAEDGQAAGTEAAEEAAPEFLLAGITRPVGACEERTLLHPNTIQTSCRRTRRSASASSSSVFTNSAFVRLESACRSSAVDSGCLRAGVGFFGLRLAIVWIPWVYFVGGSTPTA